MPPAEFPGVKQFAFTIFDDTDVATVENIRPVYRLLEDLGMRTTKTAWPVRCPEGSRNFSSSETLEDPDYREFVVDLQRRGFEIASHGATMESSPRPRTLDAMERFRDTFGAYPRLHANHSFNRENLYWGVDRLDDPVLRAVYRRMNGRPAGYYQGHAPESPYWWGDFAERHVEYARNLTFAELNVLRINPSMPYHDPGRPLVKWWFSSTDAEGADEFAGLMSRESLERLERDGGVCIVSTHLGKRYSQSGQVHPGVRNALESLARRPGWFPPVGPLLDWLSSRRTDDHLPRREWRTMQWRWLWDVVARKLQHRWSTRRR